MMPLSYISLCFLELNCLIFSFIEEVLQDQSSKHTQKSDNRGTPKKNVESSKTNGTEV